MALEIGGGITFGGGISLTVESGGGGGTPDVSGSATIALSGVTSNYGSADDSSGGYGLLTSTPAAIKYILYSVTSTETWLIFRQGTFGSLTINGTDVNGHTSTSMTCNGATASSVGSPTDIGGMYLRFVFTGDPFGLSASDGTTLPFTVTLLQPVVLLPNTMTVANDSINNYYYGSDPLGYYGGPAGMMNNEMIEALIVYWVDSSNPGSAMLYLKPGTYSNCNVGIGRQLNGDIHTYPRTFIIGNASYTFFYNEQSQAYVCPSSLNFENLVGQTISIEWDGNSTTVPANSIIVSSFTGYGQEFIGASNGYDATRSMQMGPVYGTVSSNIFNSVFFSNDPLHGYTYVTLHTGTYGPVTVTSTGLIDTDTSGSARVFTINSKRYSFTASTGGYNAFYTRTSDVGLSRIGSGTAIGVIYDPNNQGGDGHTASGYFTGGTNGSNIYGVVPGMFGSLNLIPEMIFTLNYDQMQNVTTIMFNNGTYYGGIVVDDVTATIDGKTEVSINIANITRSGTLTTTTLAGPQLTFTGDPFLLVNRVGGESAITIDTVSATSSFVTYTSGVDYYPGGQMPPAIYFQGTGPTYTVEIEQGFWNNVAGFTALHNLTASGTFNVTFGDATSYTITLSSNWTGPGPSFWTDVTSSIPLPISGGGAITPTTVSIPVASGSAGTSISATFTGAPWATSYQSGPYSLSIWYASPTDPEYIAASTAASGDIVAFYISGGTQFRGVISMVSTSTNSFYGPTGYIVTFTMSGAASGYSLPLNGSPDSSPITLYSNNSTALISGTITVGIDGSGNCGYSLYQSIGAINVPQTGVINSIIYSQYGGGIGFNQDGTYGNVTISNYGTKINNSNTIYVTIDGITKQIISDMMGWGDYGSDTFGLTSKVGQTLTFSVSLTHP